MPVGAMNLDAADVKRNFPQPVPAATDMMSAATALNSPAAVVLPGSTTSPNYLGSVEWSYSTAPTGGRLTIATPDGNLRDLDITNAGYAQVVFEPPMDCGTNKTVTISLAAGGAAVTGKLGVVAWQLK
jgi:hypothetical protein